MYDSHFKLATAKCISDAQKLSRSTRSYIQIIKKKSNEVEHVYVISCVMFPLLHICELLCSDEGEVEVEAAYKLPKFTVTTSATSLWLYATVSRLTLCSSCTFCGQFLTVSLRMTDFFFTSTFNGVKVEHWVVKQS